jgi:predicted amidohydrolase YtcJ
VASDSAPAGAWLQGRGWDQNDWKVPEYPHRALLDAVIPDRPVLLRRVDGHAAWANTEALRRAGIDAGTEDPAGGRILRSRDGQPTGILVDNAVDLVRATIPPLTREQRRHHVELAMAHCLEHGITGVHDAGAKTITLDLYKDLALAGELDVRLYCMLDDDEETLDRWLPWGGYVSPDRLLTVRAVKLYADGALGSRGALLLADYRDDPGNRGLPVTTEAHLREVARRAAKAGFQVCTHAIGDAANRNILDLYGSLQDELELKDPRWRIEHAQVLHPDDLPRFAALDVIASMQPVHCTSDMDWVEERLGPERSATAYAWRSLLDTGAHLSFGTDFPVEQVDPLHGLYAARTRTHQDGSPPGGWHPEQCLTGREALRLYTAGPAYASFREHELGQVRVNCLADLTVLSGNPITCSSEELLQLRVLLTVVGGVIRFDGRRVAGG